MLLIKMPWKINHVRNEWFIITQSAGRGHLGREENWYCFLLSFPLAGRSDVLSSWARAWGSSPTRDSPLSPDAFSLPSTQNLTRPLEARPAVMPQNQAGVEGPLGPWGAFHWAHQLSSCCQSQWEGKQSSRSLEDIEWAAWHCEIFIVWWPSRSRFLNRFRPNHRVVPLLIICSVRNRSNDLLSTYYGPCTKSFTWMISLDLHDWYE